MHHFKSFTQAKSTQDEEVRLIVGSELNLTQIELLPFFFFYKNEPKNFLNAFFYEVPDISPHTSF